MTSQPELVLRPGMLRMMLFALVSAGFAVGGAFMVRDGELFGWVPLVFFGLGAIVLTANLLPGAASLRLTPDGFTTTTLYRTTFVSWSHVHVFCPVKISSKRMIGMEYTSEYRAHPRGRAFSRGLTGVEGALDSYGLDPERLAALLND